MDNQSAAASDSNPGTDALPLLTVSRAASLATPGTTVLVKPGRYPESVSISRSGTPGAPILFLSQVPQGAVLDGADPVTQFTLEATGVWSFAAPGLAQNPYAANGEWVYVNGMPLRAATALPVQPGEFFLDFGAQKVWVAPEQPVDISQLTVEYASRQGLLASAGPGVTDIQISGFLLEHNAGWSRGQGALDISGQRWFVENNTVLWASYSAIHLNNAGACTVDGNHVAWAGVMSLAASRTANLTVSNNQFLYANWRLLDPFNESGTKWTQTIDSTVSGNEVAFNYGPGIWFDVYDGYDVISGNSTHDDLARGIFYEISWDADIHDNAVWNNGNEGLFISNSSGCTVTNNVIFNNGFGVYLNGNYTRADDHTDTQEASLLAQMSAIPGVDGGRVAAWDADYRAYVVTPDYFMIINNDVDSNLIFDNGIGMAEWREYGQPSSIAAYENNTSDNNLFGRVDSPQLFYYLSGPGTYGTGLGSWQTASGRDLHSTIADPATATNLPSWATAWSGLWASPYNSPSTYGSLQTGFVGSPSAQIARGRILRASSFTPVSFSDPAVHGLLLTEDSEQVLELWTTSIGAPHTLNLRVASTPFTVENGYLFTSTCDQADPVTVSVDHLPLFIHAADASVTEVP